MRRAPAWLQALGLEWQHRPGSEPGRLWKRYSHDQYAVCHRRGAAVAVWEAVASFEPVMQIGRSSATLTRRLIVTTISVVNITFDPAKDAANLAKHGVSLALAANIEWDGALVWRDERRAYGEVRMAGIGYIGLRLYYVVFVDRAGRRRIVSLRRANSREIKRYADA